MSRRLPYSSGSSIPSSALVISVAIFAVAASLLLSYSLSGNSLDLSTIGNVISEAINPPLSTPSQKVVEAKANVEVWADTFVEIDYTQGALIVTLTLDDGSPLPDMPLNVYAGNEVFTGLLTDDDGQVLLSMALAENSTLSVLANFLGNDSEYLNPSTNEMLLVSEIPEENVTGTPAEIKITGYDVPNTMKLSEEFTLSIRVTSLHGDSNDVASFVTLYSSDVSSESESKPVGEVRENETVTVEWKLESSACGTQYVKFGVQNDVGSIDTETVQFIVPCPVILPSVNVARVGNITIKVLNVTVGSYQDRNPETFEHIDISYIALQVVVSNDFSRPTSQYLPEDKETIKSIFLASGDDVMYPAERRDVYKLGSMYQPLLVSPIDIYPQTQKEGFLIFLGARNGAPDLSLSFKTENNTASFALAPKEAQPIEAGFSPLSVLLMLGMCACIITSSKSKGIVI